MPKKYTIEFTESSRPIRERVTKFGGQPVWLDKPEWPISRKTGGQMTFVCQVALDSSLFGSTGSKMAYLFMTENEKVDNSWDPEGGENAVIIQPGTTATPVRPASEGPSITKMVPAFFGKRLVPKKCEFAVRLVEGEDPEFVSGGQRDAMSDDDGENYFNSLRGNKIGGSPGFIQNDEFPAGGPWKLLLQLDSCEVPFWINLGDAGVAYTFISEDGKRGKFLWQCM
jgi:uncharacterized protein YwqG